MSEPKTQTPTPETDAAAIDACGHCEDDTDGQAVVPVRFARRLERERDQLKIMWERDSKALGAVIGQRDTARAVAEDNRARYVKAEAERDALYERHQRGQVLCRSCDLHVIEAARLKLDRDVALTQLDDALTRLQTAHGERDAAREAFKAACAFIDSHVADPDITAEMTAKYATFLERRAAAEIGAMTEAGR